ncbi:MAG: hypothetical protein HY314_04950 [Acidobacteria bacterium]|nr:hypothetical protein [Acidobacteriota bacterium]
MKDRDQILPLLHQRRQATFFTFDLGLYDPKWRHANYCVVCLNVPWAQGAEYIRRFLRHRRFNTKSKRMGKVIRLTVDGVAYWALGERGRVKLAW